MSQKTENIGFVCENCGVEVLPVTNGSYRNHCPFCLYSKHVDVNPGDRQSKCKGLMKPVDVRYHTKKGYQITHQCERCGTKQVNKAAMNTLQADDLEKIIKLMQAA